jgi:PIN domain nuclease of toxin-antitoxin system
VRLLLDTHVLLWSLLAPERISGEVSGLIVDPANDVYVSAVSAWEIAIKQSIGKLDLPGPALGWLPDACVQAQLDWIEVSALDALRVGALPWHHRDPFDRLLIAQTARGLVLVTHDRALRSYGVPILVA